MSTARGVSNMKEGCLGRKWFLRPNASIEKRPCRRHAIRAWTTEWCHSRYLGFKTGRSALMPGAHRL